MLKFKAFTKGLLEFRSSCTTNYDDLNLVDSYDAGRELAHRITFRRYE